MIFPDMCSRPAFPPWSKKRTTLALNGCRKPVKPDGKKVLTTPYCTYEYSKSASYPQWLISLYRSFTNQYGRGVGVIETAKQCKSIFKSIISYEKKNHEDAASVYVFNQDGDLIYPYDISDSRRVPMISQDYYTLD